MTATAEFVGWVQDRGRWRQAASGSSADQVRELLEAAADPQAGERQQVVLAAGDRPENHAWVGAGDAGRPLVLAMGASLPCFRSENDKAG
jgi:hypothetical protein